MQMRDYRIRLAGLILFSNTGLIVLIFIFYFTGGFTDEEFKELLKSLAPIKSLYIAAAVRFILNNPKAVRRRRGQQVQPQYKTLVSVFIYAHIITLYSLVTVYALGAGGSDSLGIWIAAAEAAFGTAIGAIISNIFTKQQESPAREE